MQGKCKRASVIVTHHIALYNRIQAAAKAVLVQNDELKVQEQADQATQLA